jgi:hypothetical protein
MVQILKIEKSASIQTDKLLNIDGLYKKCGFRKIDGFEKITYWSQNINNININVELWGRLSGKGAIKNDYVFPSNFDKTIYGNCCLIAKSSSPDALIDLTTDMWEHLCNKLNGVIIAEKKELPKTPTKDTSQKIDIDTTNNSTSKNSNVKNDNAYNLDGQQTDNSDNDTSSEISNMEEEDSELKEDSYLYSSEEEEEEEEECEDDEDDEDDEEEKQEQKQEEQPNK